MCRLWAADIPQLGSHPLGGQTQVLARRSPLVMRLQIKSPGQSVLVVQVPGTHTPPLQCHRRVAACYRSWLAPKRPAAMVWLSTRSGGVPTCKRSWRSRIWWCSHRCCIDETMGGRGSANAQCGRKRCRGSCRAGAGQAAGPCSNQPAAVFATTITVCGCVTWTLQPRGGRKRQVY